MDDKSHLTIYRTCVPIVDTYYSKDDDRPILEALVTAVAEAAGVPPVDVSPMYDTIDLNAISQLFDKDDETSGANSLLSFKFEQWNIFIRGDGLIRVCDGRQHTNPEPIFDGESSDNYRLSLS